MINKIRNVRKGLESLLERIICVFCSYVQSESLVEFDRIWSGA